MKIYVLTFTDGKRYVGQTTIPLKRRVQAHRAASKTVSSPLYDAWRLFGEPTVSELSVPENMTLNDAERYYIQKLKTLAPSGYNGTKGGTGKGISEGTKLKMSLTRQLPTLRETSRKRMVELHSQGRMDPPPHKTTEEIRLKMSEGRRRAESKRKEAMQRNLDDPEYRARIADAAKKAWLRRKQLT